MTLKLKRRQIEGRRVIEWSIYRGRKHIAGGMCANRADARNDANIWARDNVQPDDHMNIQSSPNYREEVVVTATLEHSRNTCFAGLLIFRRIMPNRKLGEMRHPITPSRLTLIEA